ncbi:Yhm2 protein [Starmerella bacillaris]|uniref:Yhm2 protein n=1 Tax=Starmerella bacillaris TaxID=1247836 RepID=A0AAV5RFJ1_STABA|nr:Yhm2 protein [Starmerella bacillaris]
MTPEKTKPTASNILLGSALNLFEVTTLGQPFEVIKTTMGAHRDLTFRQSISHIYSRGGIKGFWQGLIPWAWIEGSTKGAILLYTSSEVEYLSSNTLGLNNFVSGILGGMCGGIAQAYLCVGFCSTMKTAEITRNKNGGQSVGALQYCVDIYRKEGIAGLNRGVNAVALRQCTNWGSRFGLTRLTEDIIRKMSGSSDDQKLTPTQKILASALGGGLSTWNQPLDVARIEMQSKSPSKDRPANLSTLGTMKYIYSKNGLRGLYRGVTPRIGLGVWQTVCMVGLGDMSKTYIAKFSSK